MDPGVLGKFYLLPCGVYGQRSLSTVAVLGLLILAFRIKIRKGGKMGSRGGP